VHEAAGFADALHQPAGAEGFVVRVRRDHEQARGRVDRHGRPERLAPDRRTTAVRGREQRCADGGD
jgi:hypothetical protein